MKTAYILLLLFGVALSISAQNPPEEPLNRLAHQRFMFELRNDGGGQFWLSQKAAESMLLHRVDPVFPHKGMVGKVSGTVILELEIAKDGTVKHPTAVSGPKLLQAPVVAAVKQWTFKPYIFNGKPTAVATSMKMTVSNY